MPICVQATTWPARWLTIDSGEDDEAPPAILSIYTGAELERVLQRLEAGETSEFEHSTTLDLGTTAVLTRAASTTMWDEPFAFIGNRFEFRAVGSTAVPAWPNAVLNTIVAESLDHIADSLESSITDGMSDEDRSRAVVEVLQDVYRNHKRVVFNGDNYSDAWHDEAQKRGLPNLRGCADALPALGSDKARKLFSDYEVLGESELDARLMVLFETYVNIMEIEARTLIRMIQTMVVPAAVRHQSELASAVAATDAAGVNPESVRGRLTDLTAYITALRWACHELETRLGGLEGEPEAQTRLIQDSLVPAMEKVRACSDKIEGSFPDDLWPLPTYLDLLF